MESLDLETHLQALRDKRNILLRAFVINLLLQVIVLLITLTPFYVWVISFWLNDPQQISPYTLLLFTLWDVGGILLFLVPALAHSWELHVRSKTTQ